MDMTKANVHKIRKIYGICMAAYSCVVGALFIWQVWSIFRSAPASPYTVASITAAFSKIAVFVWLWVAAVVFGAFLPKQAQEKLKADVSTKIQIKILQKRLPLDEEEQGAIKSMERFRLAMLCSTIIVWIVVFIVGICFLADSSYTPRFDKEFFQEHNALVDRIICFVPWVIGGVLVSIVCAIKIEKSRILQIVLMKNMFVEKVKIGKIEKNTTDGVKKNAEKSENTYPIVRIVLGAIGVVYVVIGIFNGGMADVLEKAVKICTQCIGLG